MWRSHLFGAKIQLAPTDKLASLTYESAFASGIPNEFRVKELSEIIIEIKDRKFEG
jgi:hypothetical protein